MQILPVLDLLQGQVVRGIGGRRDQYRPIVSRLTTSCAPLEVARALRAQFGSGELYLADLDAIMGQEPAWAVYQALHQEGFILWVDAGIKELEDARLLHDAGVRTLVAGLETIARPQVLARLCADLGHEHIVFSLDLKAGVSLGKKEVWSSTDPEEIANVAFTAGVRRLLVLDLAHVGEGKGTGTLELCRRLAATYPQMRLAAGGGIAGMEDVRQLEACGVETVLIASALHDGRITAV